MVITNNFYKMKNQQSFQYFIPNYAMQPISPYYFYAFPQVPIVPVTITNTIDTNTKGNKKAYKRTWKKTQVERLYEITKVYAQQANKEIEQLTINDFEIISKETEQSAEQCMAKINEIQTSGTLRPGIWSEKEDAKLIELVESSITKWGNIANLINNEIHKGLKIRTGKHCKERWNNHLNPEIRRGNWTDEEDVRLLELHKELGNKWSNIAKQVGGRTECSVKNRIKSLLNKKRQELGVIEKPEKFEEKEINQESLLVPTSQVEEAASPRSGMEYPSFN
ncbi:unnamed protein product [Blepharisma stoltei]|uniref:Myb-like DNA-binding domain containing protein n=1 Tax=Blepharisma stoltei TaxID=1481888 RepID=A0AAU9JAM5_9CILI|nr:unnamed protein product [Blepharisma stoltei]